MNRFFKNDKLTVWVVYTEDGYETILGDGFFIYPEMAVLDRDKLKGCIKKIKQKNRNCSDKALNIKHVVFKFELSFSDGSCSIDKIKRIRKYCNTTIKTKDWNYYIFKEYSKDVIIKKIISLLKNNT